VSGVSKGGEDLLAWRFTPNMARLYRGWNEGGPTGNDVMHITRGREAGAENPVVVTEAPLFRLKVILYAARQRKCETFTDFSRS